MGKYIYGIIPNDVTQGSISSGSRRNTEAEATFGINSNSGESFDYCWILEEEKIYLVSYQDISAIVSDSEIIDYRALRKDILARLLVKHQKIIEAIMPQYSIIPMKLGTFAQDADEVKVILANAYKLIKDIFAKISDKIEINVCATWNDFNSTIKEIGEEKDIKEFKERLLANPKGISVDDQMKIGYMLKKALDRRKDEYAQKIFEALKKASFNFKMHQLMDDKMVINSAFLIDKEKRTCFDQKINELNTEFNEKLNFRCVGPLPAYSFYTLEIKKIQPQDLDWARNRLNLEGVIDKEELKRAYQRNVFSYHPDKNPNIPGMEREFDEVTRAYRILLEYYEACEQAGIESKPQALLVKVRETTTYGA